MITFAALSMFLVFHFSTGGFQQDSTIQTLNETLRSTALANRDDSARVNRGQFKLQIEQFEREFIRNFESNQNVNSENPLIDYNFDYLHDGLGGVKAIQVQITKDGQTFQATAVVDVSGGD
jgi:hypothetical protein